jgi:hypothetical protein
MDSAIYEMIGAELLLKTSGNVQEAKRLISECFLGHYVNEEACIQAIWTQINASSKDEAYELSVASDIFHHGCFSIKANGFLYVFSRY